MVSKQPKVNDKSIYLDIFDILPDNYKSALHISKKDMDIDLIAVTTNSQWIAIQCKYIRKSKYTRTPSGIPIRWSVN